MKLFESKMLRRIVCFYSAYLGAVVFMFGKRETRSPGVHACAADNS